MTLKDKITNVMHDLSKDKNTVFLGENVINSGRIYGTLDEVPLRKCIEMPICENLIAGTAIGLALAGYRPICIFQRMDFMLIAADAIINHAALLPMMSGGKIKLPIIFRTIKANLNDKFWVGHQHSKDFTPIFESYLMTYDIGKNTNPELIYKRAWNENEPTLVVEDYADFGKGV